MKTRTEKFIEQNDDLRRLFRRTDALVRDSNRLFSDQSNNTATQSKQLYVGYQSIHYRGAFEL